jgi:hypothetical protein
MPKYDPLAAYLRRHGREELFLSFRDIERILGGILPKASRSETWWAANGDAPQSRAWSSAGFEPQVDFRTETVRFIRKA